MSPGEEFWALTGIGLAANIIGMWLPLGVYQAVKWIQIRLSTRPLTAWELTWIKECNERFRQKAECQNR